MTMGETNEKTKITKLSAKAKGDRIFYWCILIFPIIQFTIFYLYVNLDSFVMVFQKYNVELKTYSFDTNDLFVNFNRFFTAFTESDEVLVSMFRSFILYLFGLFIGTPIVLYMSFVMYKKIPMHHLFKVMLYVPTIISSTVWVLLYTQLMENAVPSILQIITGQKFGGLLSNTETSFIALLYFSMWYSLGGGTILYIAAMSGIPVERSEAMKIDGAGSIREFFNLTMPSIWQIFSLGIYINISGIILKDVELYTFYGESAPVSVRTFGYWLQVRKFRAASNIFDLPYVAAIGMLQGVIFIPLMFIVRKALLKFGPKED